MNLINSFTNGLRSIYDFLFPTSAESQRRNDTKPRSSPQKVDLTFDETVNTYLTRGLWHNSVPGFKLGAPLCYNPIAVPLAFMGVPHSDLDDWNRADDRKFWEGKFKYYNEKLIKEKKTIQLMCHRDGTIWKWPWFDSQVNYVRLKTIKPEEISYALMDPDTEEITVLQTSINYQFYDENQKLYNYTETRTYTKKIIQIKRTGSVPSQLNPEDIRRNPLGMLPIRFANNIEPKELEGHSDYERIIPVIKAYSTVNRRAHENEAKMSPKLVQKAMNVNDWKNNNSSLFENNEIIDIQSINFIINIEGEETKFEVPKGLNDNAIILLKNDFKLVVESSHIPEICWGLKTEGNHASAEEQMGMLLSYVSDKQTQADKPYLKLITAIMQLEAIANTRKVPEGIKNTWNDLTSLTDVEKATIFKDIATGLEKLLANYAIDLQSAHKLLYERTNGMITSDFDDFAKQVKEYGTLKAFLEQEYISIRETEQQGQTENKDNKSKAGEKGKNGVKARN